MGYHCLKLLNLQRAQPHMDDNHISKPPSYDWMIIWRLVGFNMDQTYDLTDVVEASSGKSNSFRI